MYNTWRKIIRVFHPEGIPGLGSNMYSFLSKSGIFQEHYDLVARDITKYCASGRLLDIGTGPGWLLVAIHKLLPKLNLVGIDISPAMIDKAKLTMKKSGCREIELIVSSAAALPFDDNSFDCVVSTGSIHHWKDIKKGLAEVHRVLKEDGYALIYDLVQKVPAELQKQNTAQFGRFKMLLLWLHSFEEPFYSVDEMENLPAATPFNKGVVHFSGVLCCLVLKKT